MDYCMTNHFSALVNDNTVVVMTGPSPGFSSAGGGGKKTEGAKNQKGVPYFWNTVLDICSNQGAKCEMGDTYFKWGGRALLAPPLATALGDDKAFAPLHGNVQIALLCG